MNSEIILATQIRACNREDANRAILQIIVTTYRICGFKSSEDEVMFQVTEIMKDLTKTNLTISDLKTAFENGAKGKYGEFMGLSVLTYTKWINAYKSEKPPQTNRLIAETKKEPTIEEKEAIAEESIQAMITQFKKTGEVLNYGNSNFRYLWNTGKIRFNKVKRDEYLEQANSNIKNRLKEERERAATQLDRGKVKQIDATIENLMSESAKAEIEIEAGCLAIKDYLKTLL